MLSQIEEFVNWLRRRNSISRTWRDYGYDLKQFAATVGNKAPGQVTFRDIDLFIMAQREQGFQPTTINRRLAAIISFYAYLTYDDNDLICPVLPHRHLMHQPDRLPRPVKDDDLRAFFAAIVGVSIEAIRDRAMFTLMLRCGLRIGEVASLSLANLYLDEARPRLVVCGKGSRERAVYLSPQAERALRAYLVVRPATIAEAVFVSYQLKQLSTTAIHNRLVRYRNAAGVTFSAHRLRHTFANDMVSADVPVTTIQKLLGHRWLETTQTYVTANDHQVQADYYAACEKLESWS